MKPRSIKIRLHDGDPNGIREARIPKYTIQAIAFHRNKLGEVRERFPQIEQPGVYILIGEDEEKSGRSFAYIGESEVVGARLAYWSSKNINDFWTDTIVVISSKDDPLTKSHARYLEACLIRSMGNNPRWVLPNSKLPSGDAGKLSPFDQEDMNEFVDQTKILVGVLGWDLFREMRGRLVETTKKSAPNHREPGPDSRFFYSGDGFSAEMVLGTSGDLIVREGSKARIRETPTIPQRPKELRQTLLDSGVLTRQGDFLTFSTDYSFSHASTAAAVVGGMSVNGRTAWKLSDKRSYAEWETSQGARSKAGSALGDPESTVPDAS